MLILADDEKGFFYKVEKLLVIASILYALQMTIRKTAKRILIASDGKELLTDNSCCLAKPKYFVSHAND